MSKKVIRGIGKVAGVVAGVALIGTGIGAALGGTMILAGVGTASAIATVASIVSLGASILTKPKASAMNQASQDRLNVSLVPRAPRTMVFGRTAMATDLRDQEFTGDDKSMLHRFFVVAAHRANSIREIWFDDELAWTSTGGVQGDFVGYLNVTPVLEGSATNSIYISPRMGYSRRFTGCAYVYMRFKLTGNSKKTESPFAQQVPTRMTIIGEGIPTYDVRQDSTRGGSGPHRADDQTTWTYGAHSRNPACQLATWLLGWRIRNPQNGTWRLSVGKGIPADRIDWASFIEAANLCDEPVALRTGGTEPRYRSDGVVTEADDPMQVVEAFKACMNADLDDQDGLLRITVFHNDLATPDADFNDDDIEGAYTWVQTPSLAESFNVVRGAYVEPDSKSLYQQAEYDEARLPSPDGIDRIHNVDFGLVQSKSQAERLAKQRLQRQQYGGTFRATFLAAGWKVQKNSVIRLTCGSQGWTNKLFRVVETAVQYDGLVPMVLREEHPQIYAWDREEGPAPQIAEPTHYAPGEAPIPQFLGTIEEGATVGAPPGTPVGDRPAEEVVAEIDQHTAALNQLDQDMAAADSAIAAAESQITDLLGDMAAAEASLLAVIADIGNLEGDVETLTTTVSTLGSTVSTQATAITALQTNYASLTQTVSAALNASGEALNRNSGFDDYPSASVGVYPAGYINAGGTLNVYRVADPQGGYAMVLPGDAGANNLAGLTVHRSQRVLAVNQWYVIEADVLLRAGTFAAAGAIFRVYNGDNSASQDLTLPFAESEPSPQVGRAYGFRKLVQVTIAGARGFDLYAASHYGPFGSTAAANELEWRKLLVRPATPAEIRDQTVLAPMEATVTQHSQVLATLEGSLASLTTTVSTQGSTITTQAQAITNLQSNYATLNSTVSTLGSTVSSQGTAITTLDSNYAGLTSTVQALSARDSAALNRNAGFDDYPSAAVGAYPAGYVNAGGAANGYRVPDPQGGYAFVLPGIAGSNNIAALTVHQSERLLAVNQWYVIEADVLLRSGTFAGAGGVFRVYNGDNSAFQDLLLSFAESEPSPQGGRAYGFRKLVQATIAGARGFNLYAASHWSTFGSIAAANEIEWRKLLVRPATPAEIRDQTVLTPLQATVTQQASALATLDSQYASLSSTVTTQGLTVSQVQQSVNGMAGRWGASIDSNGRQIGYIRLDGNQSTSVVDILASAFRVTNPSGGAGLTWQNGVLWNRGASQSVIIGQDFGASGDLMFWAGPTPASPSGATKANGVLWFDRNGSAYFGGSLSAGTIKNAVQTTSIAANASVTTGPVGSNGGARLVVVSYNLQQSATITAGGTSGSGSTSATVQIQRNGVNWQTLNVGGTWNRTPAAGGDPGSYTAQMGGSMTLTDTSGGTTVSYTATIISRDTGPGPNGTAGPLATTQVLSITETEQ